MTNKFLKQAVLFSTLLLAFSSSAGTIYVDNQEDVEVTVTVRPDNGGPLDPKDHLEVVVQPGQKAKVPVDTKTFGKHFHLKGQVGTVMLEHDKLPSHNDYDAVYSKSENGGAIDVLTKLENKPKSKSKHKNK